ncbi:MAG: alpha-glucan family phosphorylase, partial [Acidimicrobiales bacterium]
PSIVPARSIPPPPSTAYFSMEIAVADEVPTYSGGLGVLAGDHLRAAADLELPLVAVTLCYRNGYFAQALDTEGRQREAPVTWSREAVLQPVDARTTVRICGRSVRVAAWRFDVVGRTGHVVPVFLLDTDVDGNDEHDRAITDQLYAGDGHHRLRQEAVLGLGGVGLLEVLGWGDIATLHMNEGHSALLALALARPAGHGTAPVDATLARSRCVFTTHTPVPAGHDRFGERTVREVLGDERAADLAALGGMTGGELNMTRLGMACAHYVNAVSLRHGDVCREMFPDVPVDVITNGVHAATWVGPHMAELLDRRVPGWDRDNAALRYCGGIALEEIEVAHSAAKRDLVRLVAGRTGVALDPAVLTLCAARRAAAYKRIDLILRDPDRLAAVVERTGPLQIVYSGKAHPQDEDGKAVIERVFAAARGLGDRVHIAYVPDYSMADAAVLCAGADVWVNTPERPLEASGTSGIKAALNGVPSLSVLDGWWLEGHVEGVTGWSVGGLGEERDDGADADDLYTTLELDIAPRYYGNRGLAEVRRGALALNGSWFTTERMVRQYAAAAYGVAGTA